MGGSVLVWPASGYDDELLQAWGLQEAAGSLPTPDDVRAACVRLGWTLAETTVSYTFGRLRYSTWVGTMNHGAEAGPECTRLCLTEQGYRFEMGTLAAVWALTSALAEACGPQVLSFSSGRADVAVTGATCLADVKAAYALAGEEAYIV